MVGPKGHEPLLYGDQCFVIAEAGVNHNGNVDTAKALIDAAANAGADAVKFQTFRADLLVNRDASKAAYQVETTGSEDTQYDMLRKLELPDAAFKELKDRCEARDIMFMSTPFDEASADLLESLSMEIFKIGSSELTNLEFLRHVARKSKPMIVSTGMARLGEVEEAIDAIVGEGNDDLVLMHCVSNYPADPSEMNLRAIETMAIAFDRPVGLSDHTEGIEVALAAVALGASVIEKHFTLDRAQDGPDHRASIERDQLESLVRGVRSVEAALGDGLKRPSPGEADVMAVARRSLVVSQDLTAGATLTSEVLTARRPGTGLPPMAKPYVLGRKLRVDVGAGTLLNLEMLV